MTMNYSIYKLIGSLFCIYFSYACYKGYPSLIDNLLRLLSIKKHLKLFNQIYNACTAIFLLILIIVLEMKTINKF